MPSSLYVVNEIQQLLALEGWVDEAGVQELAAQYKALCDSINQRSSQCLELVRLGRRPEAVALVRQAPDLENEIELLDFPQFDTWVNMCNVSGIELDRGLDVASLRNVVREVLAQNTTYEQSLRALRRMSLGRAPLSRRVATLRQIVGTNLLPSLWRDDLKEFEVAYVEELLRVAETAGRAKDLPTMESVLAELRASSWVTPVPQRAIQAVERSIQPHRQVFARERYSQLAEQLREAHGRLDQTGARQLREQWQQLEASTGVPPAADAAESVAAILHWLSDLDRERDEQQRYEMACCELEEALDDSQGRPTLERLCGVVQRFERGMPSVLSSRLASRLEELARHARRRFTYGLTAVFAAVLLIAAGIAVGMDRYKQAEALDNWRGEIDKALTDDDLNAAGLLLARLDQEAPRIAAKPEIDALRKHHEQKLQSEQQRRENFAQAISAVEAAGLEKPDKSALAQAARLARGDQEQLQVQAWQQKIEDQHRELRRRLSAEFAIDLRKLHEQFVVVHSADELQRSDSDTLAIACLALARRLVTDDRASEIQHSEVANIELALLKRSAERGRSLERQRMMSQAVRQIAGLADRPQELEKALTTFVEEYPEHPLAADFARAISYAIHARPVAAWGQIAGSWSTYDTFTDQQTTALRLKQVEQFLSEQEASCHTMMAETYRSYLQSIIAAWGSGSLQHLATLRQDMTRSFMVKTNHIRTAAGAVYYFSDDPQDCVPERINEQLRSYAVRYMRDSSGSVMANARIAAADVVGKPGPAPQCQLADELGQRLGRFGATGWETLYLSLAEQVRVARGVDPILKGLLMKKLLAAAMDCTPWKTDEIKQLLDVLSAVDLDVAWLDPDDAAANRSRPRATTLIAAMPSFAAMIMDVETRVRSLPATCKPFKAVCVYLSPDHRPEIASVAAGSTLYTMVQGEKGRAMQQVGKLVDGRVVLDEATSLPQGVPLFTRE